MSYSDPNYQSPFKGYGDFLKLNGLLKYSLNHEVSWTGRIITIGYGYGTNGGLPSDAHFNIQFPSLGTAVNVYPTGTRIISATGLLLNSWETLYYKLPMGAGPTMVPGNFLIVPYTTNFDNSAGDYVPLVQRLDLNGLHTAWGDRLTRGAMIGAGEEVQANIAREARDGAGCSGHQFITTAYAYGFTGMLSWMTNSQIDFASGNSLRRVDAVGAAAGTIVKGIGVADKAWRAPAATDRMENFLRFTHDVNPISLTTPVVDIAEYQALYYEVPPDATGSLNGGNWYIVGNLPVDFVVPSHWLLVCRRSVGWGRLVKLGTGHQIALGQAVHGSALDLGTEASIEGLRVTSAGDVTVRRTTPGYFNATGLINGSAQLSDGVLVSWPNTSLIYGMSNGYEGLSASDYLWIDMPPVGTDIPVMSVFTIPSGTVRRVEANGIPLGAWEALIWKPPSLSGPLTNSDGFGILRYGQTSPTPVGYIVIAKHHASTAEFGLGKGFVRWADGSRKIIGQAFSAGDGGMGSGPWRGVVLAGAPVNATVSAFTGLTPQYKLIAGSGVDGDKIALKGVIAANAAIPDGSIVLWMPGARIPQNMHIMVAARRANSNVSIGSALLRFENATSGGIAGVQASLYSYSAANTGMGAYGAGGYISLDGLNLIMEA